MIEKMGGILLEQSWDITSVSEDVCRVNVSDNGCWDMISWIYDTSKFAFALYVFFVVVNSLRPIDTMWHHGTWATLLKLMAWWHYWLRQWLIAWRHQAITSRNIDIIHIFVWVCIHAFSWEIILILCWNMLNHWPNCYSVWLAWKLYF